jgi:hypothetical protein
MARRWSIALLLLLTLPMAAPATAPIQGEARWDSAAPLRYKVKSGESLRSISRTALTEADSVAMLAAANGLGVDSRLRAGQYISIPSSMLRRDALRATVVSFSGDVRLGKGAEVALWDALHEGDVIEVGANSFVTLDMDVAGRVTLPSQSRVRIAALHRVAVTGEVRRELDVQPIDKPWLAFGSESEGGNRVISGGRTG